MKIQRFEPYLRQTIWGGEKIVAFKHLVLPNASHNIGESWELSGVAHFESSSINEPNLSLNQLVAKYKERLVGRANYLRFGNEFPLLIKFIDARQDLSIQVHPDDETARRQGKPRGKTEMWYLMESEPSARLYSGIRKAMTSEQYKQMVADNTICEALAQYSVKEGDVFFLPAGRIHAIGAGCMLAEIQQSSDVTYRIYDYGRRDNDGNLRPLHTQEAAESIDYTVCDDYRTHYTPQQNVGVQLVNCSYFTTSIYDITQPTAVSAAMKDTFLVLIGLKGSGQVCTPVETVVFNAGDTLLVPADNNDLTVQGDIKFLEVHIED